MNFFTHAGILTTYGGISLFPVFSVLHHLLKTSYTEILAFLSFPPYQYNTYAHHVRRNISFPDSLRTSTILVGTFLVAKDAPRGKRCVPKKKYLIFFISMFIIRKHKKGL